ncbi:hypothetical protein ACFS5L_00620 [Streptomyces phyllanthi]|uniref:Uncharacterized protein n=1 Tax=Streptomyces phyllanthi TaxID=1803180 RepID=A0A5N8WAH1_9ACTN|nr:hypothetical protein [Streptomyces phyllanthi]MPY44132.1 hypothetical protein [Streptomyces phyllanthi]
MAKNKNRKQADRQSRTSRPEHMEEQDGRSPMETQQTSIAQPQGNPADVARKKQKSFGHN